MTNSPASRKPRHGLRALAATNIPERTLLLAPDYSGAGRSVCCDAASKVCMKSARTIQLVVIFAIAFAFVESSVVVYLRQIFYPEGFSFPLTPASVSHVGVELAREFATIVMLVVVAMIAGSSRWQRFSYFLIGFGVWDILFYVWLKLILNWPVSVLDWDILFLIPIPWIGPVIAPVLVSLAMIAGGLLILRKEEQDGSFRSSPVAVASALLGSVAILASFMLDTDATLRFQYPKPYHYELLALGMACYAAAFIATARTPASLRDASATERAGRGEKEGSGDA